jgi:hypothetical protein
MTSLRNGGYVLKIKVCVIAAMLRRISMLMLTDHLKAQFDRSTRAGMVDDGRVILIWL